VDGLTLAHDHLYWIDKLVDQSGDSRGEMWMLDDSGTPVRIADVPTSSISVEGLFFDEPRDRLVWVSTALLEFPLDSKAWRVWKHSYATSRGSARDDTYLYWTVSSTQWGHRGADPLR
jgi:hypothetical protein